MKIRLRLIEENGAMFMTLPYSTIESSNFMNLCQKGHVALKGGEQGFRAMLVNIALLSGHALTCVISFFYVSSYAPYLLLLVFLIVFIHRYIRNRNKRKEKEIRDEMVSESRETEHLYDVTSSFRYGKEIRLYSFSDWVERKLNTVLSSKDCPFLILDEPTACPVVPFVIESLSLTREKSYKMDTMSSCINKRMGSIINYFMHKQSTTCKAQNEILRPIASDELAFFYYLNTSSWY
jgi:hypothetical protein